MTAVLYAPSKERIVTTNAWAFLHWLRGVRNIDLERDDDSRRNGRMSGSGETAGGWEALQRWSAEDPAAFAAAVADFAHLTGPSLRLCRHGGLREALVWRNQALRISLTGDDCAASVAALPREVTPALPPDIAAALRRDWTAEMLIWPAAELLLHADLRPDDRVLVAGATWPWLAALLEGTTVIFAAPDDLLNVAQQECATVLVAAPEVLSEAAFRRPGRRLELAQLRTIVASGGPLSPETRRRIYTWVKADVMLLARTGDRFWGNPLDPVLAHPPARPAFLKGGWP